MLDRLKSWARRLRSQLSETAICLALGLKDSLRWALLWRGVRLAAMLALFWLGVFVVWRVDLFKLALLLGGMGVYEYVLPLFQLVPVLALYGGALAVGTAIVLSPFAAVVLIIVTYLGLLLLSFRWLAVRSLFPRVLRCVERQYASPRPDTPHAPAGLAWTQHLRLILTAVIGTAVCLLLPLTGGLFLLLWVGYLSTRSAALRTMKGVASGDHTLRLVRQARLPLTLIGTCMTLLLLVPVFGLIAPTAMTAAAAHLMKRSLERLPDESAV